MLIGERKDQIHKSLYSREERERRDASPWTTVQAILAPLQFIVFAVSLVFVFRYLSTGDGYALTTASIIFKTLILYTIMVTGAIWEKAVFGQYLFVPAFFWEDVFSMLVLALHTAYLIVTLFSLASPRAEMFIALAAYGAYIINAGQFLLKLRQARLQPSSSELSEEFA
ncbi:MAG: 2-vinyl bacteriochlorophyllide hydratase [Pseudomonadota bacterium]